MITLRHNLRSIMIGNSALDERSISINSALVLPSLGSAQSPVVQQPSNLVEFCHKKELSKQSSRYMTPVKKCSGDEKETSAKHTKSDIFSTKNKKTRAKHCLKGFKPRQL